MDVEDAATAKKKAEEKKKNQKMVGFGRLFTYADGLDYLLYFIGERDRDGSVPLFDTRRLLVLVMAHARPSLFTHTGCLGAIGGGMVWPMFSVLFGELIDSFETFGTQTSILDKVADVAL